MCTSAPKSSASAQRAATWHAQAEEYLVGLHRPHWDELCSGKSGCQPIGHRVGMPRKLEPQIVGEISVNLGGKETMFGQKMSGAFTAFGHERCAFWVKEHDSFCRERAGLGNSK